MEEVNQQLIEDPTAVDAEWKKIQQNTLTRWCNEHLKVAQKYISNLETDLSDGLRLIALLEVLSQKRMPRFNKKPVFRPMQIENVSIALKFIENENIRLVNIDATDIVNGKLKLIIGLIFTLILTYSIKAMLNYENNKQSPKEKMLEWINGKVPDKPINNFNKDWINAQAIGALVDAFAPGLCPDWEDWDPKDALKNATEAMKLAEDWLDVPQVLIPEDMTNPNVDEMSIMTYLSAFLKAKLKPGAPLRPKKVDDSMEEAGYGGNWSS